MEDDTFSTIDSLRGTPESELPALTVSPADTSLHDDSPSNDLEDSKDDDKKPAKKRKSWGQELPVPKTNLPPRYVAPASLPQSNEQLLIRPENEPRQMTKRSSAE